jgi:hypothetical protein
MRETKMPPLGGVQLQVSRKCYLAHRAPDDTYLHELMASQKQAMTHRLKTTNLDPQYPNVAREVTAKGV